MSSFKFYFIYFLLFIYFYFPNTLFFFYCTARWPSFLLFKAALVAYGSSQARCQIRAVAMQDPSTICDLYHSSRQHQILNPLSEARDQTGILMDTSRVCNLLSHNRNSLHFCSWRWMKIWHISEVWVSRLHFPPSIFFKMYRA